MDYKTNPPVYETPAPQPMYVNAAQPGVPVPGQVYVQQPPQMVQVPGMMPAQVTGMVPAPGVMAGPMPGIITQATTGKYLNATPIGVLGRGAAPVDCPACGNREMTRVTYEVGNTTHAWGLGLCLLFCLGCIPYLMNDMKDVRHHCGRCGVLLATWHRSGNTEVHQHA